MSEHAEADLNTVNFYGSSRDLDDLIADAQEAGLTVVSRRDRGVKLTVPELADAIVTQLLIAGGTKAVAAAIRRFRKSHPNPDVDLEGEDLAP